MDGKINGARVRIGSLFYCVTLYLLHIVCAVLLF